MFIHIYIYIISCPVHAHMVWEVTPPHPSRHLQGRIHRHIHIDIQIYIYILYIFAHTYTAFVYTHPCVYIIYIIVFIYIYTYIYIYCEWPKPLPLVAPPHSKRGSLFPDHQSARVLPSLQQKMDPKIQAS